MHPELKRVARGPVDEAISSRNLPSWPNPDWVGTLFVVLLLQYRDLFSMGLTAEA